MEAESGSGAGPIARIDRLVRRHGRFRRLTRRPVDQPAVRVAGASGQRADGSGEASGLLRAHEDFLAAPKLDLHPFTAAEGEGAVRVLAPDAPAAEFAQRIVPALVDAHDVAGAGAVTGALPVF